MCQIPPPPLLVTVAHMGNFIFGDLHEFGQIEGSANQFNASHFEQVGVSANSPKWTNLELF